MNKSKYLCRRIRCRKNRKRNLKVVIMSAVLAVVVIFGVIFRFAVKWFTGRGNRLAITYALVFVCIGLGEMLNVSSLLACMALGATLANTSNFADVVFEQTDRMTPPVFMMFFFLSGAALDISIIPSVGVIGIIYIIFRVLGKMLGSFAGAKISKADKNVQKFQYTFTKEDNHFYLTAYKTVK